MSRYKSGTMGNIPILTLPEDVTRTLSMRNPTDESNSLRIPESSFIILLVSFRLSHKDQVSHL